MYLLRNHGRYRPEKYFIQEIWAQRIAFRVETQQYVLAAPQQLAGQPPVQADGLPSVQYRFPITSYGMGIVLETPPVPIGAVGSAEGYLEATLSLPIRQHKDADPGVYVSPPLVARELCDALTVFSGSYVISRIADGIEGTIEERSDRPSVGAAPPNPALKELCFDLEQWPVYQGLLLRFMGLPWRRHRALLDAFRCYRLALGVCQISPSLSYLLLVAAIEACSREFAESEPTFEDFSDQLQGAVQAWSSQHAVDPDLVSNLKERLLEAEKGRIGSGRAFRDVVLSFLPPEFWDGNMGGAVTAENLPQRLRAAYAVRSQFVHQAWELGTAAGLVAVDALPVLVYDLDAGKLMKKPQVIPTLDFLARLTRCLLIAILQAHHPPLAEGVVDPEIWLIGKSDLVLPKGTVFEL